MQSRAVQGRSELDPCSHHDLDWATNKQHRYAEKSKVQRYDTIWE